MGKLLHWYNINTLHSGMGKLQVLTPGSIAELQDCLELCHTQNKKILPLGSGTNLLGRDDDYSHIAIRLPGCLSVQIAGTCCSCGTGVLGNRLLSFLAKQGLGGAVPLSGIPGTLGGMLKMNAGALGMEISSLVQEMMGIDLDTGKEWHWTRQQGGWNYRTSPVPDGVCVTQAILQFERCSPESEFSGIATEMERRRKCTPSWWSAGSIFRNPSSELPAGKLLEEAGCKGMQSGPFQVSAKHANWIVNAQHQPGYASSVKFLIASMQQKSSVPLHCEIKIV